MDIATVKWGSVDPNPIDEPTVIVKIFGRNEAPTVEMHGWSHYFPVNFPNLEQGKVIKVYHPDVLETIGEDVLSRKVKKQYEDRRKLSDLVCQRHGSRMVRPVAVTVVGKKQLELVARADGTVLIFGQILVADETDVCTVKFVNTAIQRAYKQIHIGDRLVIGYGTVQSPLQGEEETSFHTQLYFQSSVIKIGDFDIYHVHKVKRGVEITPMPDFILRGKKLWTPSGIAAEPIGYRVVDSLVTVDIIGVVSHVSRLERQRRYESKVTLDNGMQEEHFVQFNVLCWIELVDLNSKDPIPVKLLLSSLLWDNQTELVPGSLIVITHVKPGDTLTICTHPYLQSSSFTQVYINSRVFDYLLIMGRKPEFVDIAKQFVGIQESGRILARKDITWSVGGSYALPIKDSTEFLRLFYNKRDGVDGVGPPWTPVPEMPLFRRESQILVFKAYLLRYHLFEGDWGTVIDSWHWINNSAFKRPEVKNRNIRTIYDPIPVDARNTSVWSMFTRRFHEHKNLFNDIPEASSTSDFRQKIRLYERVAERRKKYTKPLCMPAGPGKDLKKLPVIDGTPHYAVDLWNLDGKGLGMERLIMTWKPSRHLGIPQIKTKLKALRKCEEVFVIAEIYRTESHDLEEKYGHQFMIHDITPCGLEEVLNQSDLPMDTE